MNQTLLKDVFESIVHIDEKRLQKKGGEKR